MRKRFFVGIFAINLLVGCQANYIRDVQGGTVAPSSSSKLGEPQNSEKIVR
ncbi:lysis protein [Salmonella enterica]|nr:lysis protein [Salmonella enterica]